jgi:hypothetical protein
MRFYSVILMMLPFVVISSCANQPDERLVQWESQNASEISLLKIEGTSFGTLAIKPAESFNIGLEITNLSNEKLKVGNIFAKGKDKTCMDLLASINKKLSSCINQELEPNQSCSYTLVLRPDRQDRVLNKTYIIDYSDANDVVGQQEFILNGNLKVELNTALLGIEAPAPAP